MTVDVPLLLFLDFDGVLHPTIEVDDATGAARVYQGPEFTATQVLVDLLRPRLEAIDIVISSTWGRRRDLATLQGLLPAALAARVTDAVHHRLPPLEAIGQGKGLGSRWAGNRLVSPADPFQPWRSMDCH